MYSLCENTGRYDRFDRSFKFYRAEVYYFLNLETGPRWIIMQPVISLFLFQAISSLIKFELVLKRSRYILKYSLENCEIWRHLLKWWKVRPSRENFLFPRNKFGYQLFTPTPAFLSDSEARLNWQKKIFCQSLKEKLGFSESNGK